MMGVVPYSGRFYSGFFLPFLGVLPCRGVLPVGGGFAFCCGVLHLLGVLISGRWHITLGYFILR
jgi:hypothetical protein